MSVAEVAERAGLSHNACWRRIKRLETDGVITGRVALVDPAALGFAATLFVFVRTSRHDEEWLAQFAEGVVKIPEVVELHRLGGDIDYLLKIVARDIADYDRIYKKLIKVAPLSDITSAFSMQAIKTSTATPVGDEGGAG
ncbi:MAG: Lrp/AsnC family transcriptional regulator [Caulobacterales bacterium]|nr:Lrp/AsnC family transcriptional regulator [Caulobacterales bacterium]